MSDTMCFECRGAVQVGITSNSNILLDLSIRHLEDSRVPTPCVQLPGEMISVAP